MGNSRARAVYEAQLPDGFRRPQTDSALESFIRAKYEHKKYVAREWVQPPPVKANWDKEIEEEMEKQKRKKKGLGIASTATNNGKPADTKKTAISLKSTPIPAPLPKPTVRSSFVKLTHERRRMLIWCAIFIFRIIRAVRRRHHVFSTTIPQPAKILQQTIRIYLVPIYWDCRLRLLLQPQPLTTKRRPPNITMYLAASSADQLVQMLTRKLVQLHRMQRHRRHRTQQNPTVKHRWPKRNRTSSIKSQPKRKRQN